MQGPLVVLDDDPTGTQALAGVPVLLRWDRRALLDAADDGPRAIHLSTNSRALAPPDARRVVADAARTAVAALPGAEVVLRGDSTLRGHLLEEYEALRDATFPGADPVLLLAPALPAAGRVTVGGVHLLERDGRRVPLHDTEYARDPAFSYHDARLLAWAQERSGGHFRAADGAEVHLDALRGQGGDAVAGVLAELAERAVPAVCAADAEDADDLRLIAGGLARARTDGVPVLLRCAPTMVGVISGATALGLVPVPRAKGSVLVVCGSYVPTATRQLAALVAAYPGTLVEADTGALASPDPDGEVRRLAGAVDARLTQTGLAVLATPRVDDGGPGDLDRQAQVASRLAAVLRVLPRRPGVVVAKGGVTSAVTAREGLGVTAAQVRGPVADGVGLWDARTGDGDVVAYLVVPGNVGDDDLLVRLVAMVRGEDVETP